MILPGEMILSQKFIKNLSADLKPIKVIRFGLKENLLALLVGLFSVMAGLAISGIRFNIAEVIWTSRFMIQSVLLYSEQWPAASS